LVRDKVFAGTGEGNHYEFMGQGLLQSINAGKKWDPLVTQPFLGEGFFELAVDRVDPATVYACTTLGAYLSADEGRTWYPVLTGHAWGVSQALPAGGAPHEILVATATGLHASFDQGRSWSPVRSIPTRTRAWTRLAVRHVPTDSSRVFVFGQPADARAPAELWERAPNGDWHAVPVPADLDTKQASYDWCLEIEPVQGLEVYLGAIDLHRGLRDNFETWHWENMSARTGSVGNSIHPDQHCVVFDPRKPGRIFVGNDGGVYRSDDAGRTWTACVQGLGITEVEHIALNIDDAAWVLAGTQDNGTIRYRKGVWDHVADGDGGSCGASSGDPSRVYHTYTYVGVQRSRSGGDFDTWSASLPSGPAGLFYPPLKCGSRLVVQAGAEIWLSPDAGDSWAMVELPWDVGFASALTAPSEDRVVVGTDRGAVFEVVRTSGGFWRLFARRTPLRGYIADLAHDPRDARRLWLASTYNAVGERVMFSGDAGDSWTSASGNLPPVPACSVAVDPDNGDRVWVGTDSGVYETVNGGTSWAPLGVGLPNVLVGELVLHVKSRLLRAATQSRGVWETQV
jgi:photosystem II stability/assembly factor-like uncharacterized protein